MKKGKSETRLPKIGGDGGIRTLDLTDANRTLSQLSYAPMSCQLDSFCIIAYFSIL